MKTMRSKDGFSLIELLTVIAIIAILAGIIFPAMTAVKNRAKVVQCMANLHDIAMALKMFQMDNRKYPETLSGYVQYNGGAVIPLERTQVDPLHPALYPEYVKSVKGFHCPLSQVTKTDDVTVLDNTYEYYSYDSYSLYTAGLTSPEAANSWALRYTLSWAPDLQAVDDLNASPPGTPKTPALAAVDYKRQLKFRQPSDDTVVTWCTYHRRVGDAHSMVPVLFLDGHADLIPAVQVEGLNSTEDRGDPGSRWRTQPKR
jgi:prepilin-type N-terminal cleavage/methylation domain-containing protein